MARTGQSFNSIRLCWQYVSPKTCRQTPTKDRPRSRIEERWGPGSPAREEPPRPYSRRAPSLRRPRWRSDEASTNRREYARSVSPGGGAAVAGWFTSLIGRYICRPRAVPWWERSGRPVTVHRFSISGIGAPADFALFRLSGYAGHGFPGARTDGARTSPCQTSQLAPGGARARLEDTLRLLKLRTLSVAPFGQSHITPGGASAPVLPNHRNRHALPPSRGRGWIGALRGDTTKAGYDR